MTDDPRGRKPETLYCRECGAKACALHDAAEGPFCALDGKRKGDGCEHGRPSVRTPDVRDRLLDAFGYGATKGEACAYAGITPPTLDAWLEDEPALQEEVDKKRELVLLRARQAVVKNLDEPNFALRFLERKRPEEFGATQKVHHTGEVLHKPDPEGLRKLQQIAQAINGRLRDAYAAPILPEGDRAADGK